ncbi:MAG: ABC transporter ATP-binding protein [Anaerofustis sp.]
MSIINPKKPNKNPRNQKEPIEYDKTKLLDINDLKISFFTHQGEVKAVDGISYSLKYGDIIGIVGESGSGKSVEAYSILGLTENPGRVVGGSIIFDGENIVGMNEDQLQHIRGNKISFIFQDPMTSLNPVFTIGNQLTEVILRHTDKSKEEANARALELLRLVGMNEPEKRMKQYPHEFSGGMRQRVMIAMALACEPKLLIADEPTTALDVTIQAQILELISELKEKIGMSIILITHDLGVVAGMCENIIVMYAGKIVERGKTDEIFYQTKHPYTMGLLNSIPKINATGKERLIPIEGSPVDLLNPPEGCAFAPRCAHCMKICLREYPPMSDVSETHSAACWLIQKETMEQEGK